MQISSVDRRFTGPMLTLSEFKDGRVKATAAAAMMTTSTVNIQKMNIRCKSNNVTRDSQVTSLSPSLRASAKINFKIKFTGVTKKDQASIDKKLESKLVVAKSPDQYGDSERKAASRNNKYTESSLPRISSRERNYGKSTEYNGKTQFSDPHQLLKLVTSNLRCSQQNLIRSGSMGAQNSHLQATRTVKNLNN